MEIPNYLFFIATFADGTQIEQNAEDKGSIEGKNCYFDVLQKQLDVPLVCFVLGAEGYPTFGVDLRDGHFEINGVPFFQHEQPLKDFRLFYVRDVQIHKTFAVNDPDNAKMTADLGYVIGWEAVHNGEFIKRVIKI